MIVFPKHAFRTKLEYEKDPGVGRQCYCFISQIEKFDWLALMMCCRFLLSDTVKVLCKTKSTKYMILLLFGVIFLLKSTINWDCVDLKVSDDFISFILELCVNFAIHTSKNRHSVWQFSSNFVIFNFHSVAKNSWAETGTQRIGSCGSLDVAAHL